MQLTEEQIQSNLKAYEHAMRNGNDTNLELMVANRWVGKHGLSFDALVPYRIRPTPRLRPWKPEEVPVGAIVRNKGETARYLIIGAGNDFVAYSQCGQTDLQSMLEYYDHSTDGGATWKPCGVMEEGE